MAAPRPPFIRTPEPVKDLSASQNGYDVVLSWTNPAHYIDGSPADDLYKVIVESDGNEIATLDATAAGKPQSYPIAAKSWLGTSRSFTVRLQTLRFKMSDRSNVTSFSPMDVPGAVVDLNSLVDQHVITLTWKSPGSLADGYFVSRVNPPEPPTLTQDLKFSDTSFEPGGVYTYVVTAARHKGDIWVQGSDPTQIKVTAVDKTPPKPPTGLDFIAADNGAYVTWDPNNEADLAGYHLFRDGSLVGDGLRTTNSFFDPAYKAGAAYSVSAVDEYGNESARSRSKSLIR